MRIVPLGEVCQIVNGGTPKSNVTEYWDGNVAWLTPAQMGKQSSPKTFATDRTISEKGLANSSAKLVPPSSVILSTRAPIGHLSINEVPMAFNQGCRGLVPSEQVDTAYLYYFLYSSRSALDALGTGTTFKELAASRLKEFPIPLPPLAEQRRIVATLDKAFAGIATATANAEKNMANALELFEVELDREITNIQTNVPSRPLNEFCREITVGHVGSMKSRYVEDGIPFLRSQNIRPFRVDLDGVLYINSAFDSELDKSRLRPGDVAVVRTGYPGTAAVIPKTMQHANCADLVLIRPDVGLDPHFLVAFLNSNYGKRLVAGNLNGAAQKHFNVGSAKKALISVPPLEAQQKLLQRVESLRHASAALAVSFERKQAAIAQLRKAILAKAFSGELPNAKQAVAA